jgi:hypothetical protein
VLLDSLLIPVTYVLQARAEIDAAKQQLVLLQAEADGARIRGNAEAQAAQVSWTISSSEQPCNV